MSHQYTSVHEAPNGAGDARPTAKQIVEAEHLVDGLKGKTILITGCSSGIGVETAKALFATGADLYLTARDVEKARNMLPDMVMSERVHFLHLDLERLASVRECAQTFLKWSPRLNILIANAGVMHTPKGQTADGFETQFGSNFLAHYLLFNLLKPMLLASAGPGFASRVVIVSSSGHRICGVNFDDLNFEKRSYDGWLSYGQSKTAGIYMANEINRRYGPRNLHGLSLHPGSIFSGLQKTVPNAMKEQWKQDAVLKIIKSPRARSRDHRFRCSFKVHGGQGRNLS